MMMTKDPDGDSELRRSIDRAPQVVKLALETIRYGEVTVKVENGKPIWVDKYEREREGGVAMLSWGDVVSLAALLLALCLAWYQVLAGARLVCQNPLMFSIGAGTALSLPAIVVPITIRNAGARAGQVRDIALRVTRKGTPCAQATFQSFVIGQNPKYITVREVEDNASPMRYVVVQGHLTETVVIEFTKRSRAEWAWEPGKYVAEIYSLECGSGWVFRASFTFSIPEDEKEAVHTYKRWTDEVIASRDAFCDWTRSL